MFQVESPVIVVSSRVLPDSLQVGWVVSQEFVGDLLPPSYLYKRAEICVLVQFDLQPFLSLRKSPNILRVEVAEVSCSGQENVTDSAQQAAFFSSSNKEEI